MADKNNKESELKIDVDINAFATKRLTIGDVDVLIDEGFKDIKKYFEDKYGLNEEQTKELYNKTMKVMGVL